MPRVKINLGGKTMNKGVLRYLRTQVKDMLVKRLMIDMHCPRGKAKALAKRFVRSESVPALKNALQTKCRRLDLRGMVQQAQPSNNDRDNRLPAAHQTRTQKQKQQQQQQQAAHPEHNSDRREEPRGSGKFAFKDGLFNSNFPPLQNISKKCRPDPRMKPAPSTHRTQNHIWCKLMEADLIDMESEKLKKIETQRQTRHHFTSQLNDQVAKKQRKRELQRQKKKTDLIKVQQRQRQYAEEKEEKKLRKVADRRLHQREIAKLITRKKERTERAKQKGAKERQDLLQRMVQEQARARKEQTRRVQAAAVKMAKIGRERENEIKSKAFRKAKEAADDVRLGKEWSKMMTARENKRTNEVLERKKKIDEKLKLMEKHYANAAQTIREVEEKEHLAVQDKYKEEDRKSRAKRKQQKKMQAACNAHVAKMIEDKEEKTRQRRRDRDADNEQMRKQAAAFEREKELKLKKFHDRQRMQRKMLDEQVRWKVAQKERLQETEDVLLMNKKLLQKIQSKVDVADILSEIPKHAIPLGRRRLGRRARKL